MSIFRRRLAKVKCKTWVRDGSFKFPELDDLSLAGRPNVGVAFSGGGTRAAAAALGQLRALDQLGALQRMRYISSVSGGTWACIPYVYLPRPFSDKCVSATATNRHSADLAARLPEQELTPACRPPVHPDPNPWGRSSFLVVG